MIKIHRYSHTNRSLHIQGIGFVSYTYIYSLLMNEIDFIVLDYKTKTDITYETKIKMLCNQLQTNTQKLSDNSLKQLLLDTE